MFTVTTKPDTFSDKHGITPNLTNMNFIFGTKDTDYVTLNKNDYCPNITLESEAKINIEKGDKYLLCQISDES